MAGVTPVRWWHWLPRPFRKWHVLGYVEAGDLVPDRLPRRSAVLIGSEEHPTWAAFDCPCAEKHRLMVNLDSGRRPSWRVEAARPLTLKPSIDDVTAGRRCHFFITKGRTVWARSDRRSSP